MEADPKPSSVCVCVFVATCYLMFCKLIHPKVLAWDTVYSGSAVSAHCVHSEGFADHVCVCVVLTEAPTARLLHDCFTDTNSHFLVLLFVQTARRSIPCNPFLFFFPSVCKHIANWLRGLIGFQVLMSCLIFHRMAGKKLFKLTPGDRNADLGERQFLSV